MHALSTLHKDDACQANAPNLLVTAIQLRAEKCGYKLQGQTVDD
jgi:hypothetical protein